MRARTHTSDSQMTKKQPRAVTRAHYLPPIEESFAAGPQTYPGGAFTLNFKNKIILFCLCRDQVFAPCQKLIRTFCPFTSNLQRYSLRTGIASVQTVGKDRWSPGSMGKFCQPQLQETTLCAGVTLEQYIASI